ncbi:hypothetical protein [endosymbiont of Ridgeia piscesae]|jgi:hypothetical protein|uniref:Uncharacterized protein n=2 Tax=endosymbiont of Ridgeia piscesae TaxID=54398 RepID=A0A0T5YYQ1_9GAMM|nr:hypothetical protein [endosymbiont of Ridgeia piscesae]KRT55724.1 hypothetical protein Ga0074115_12331 [endosymbiont of Ridgeia piscesae]KRT59615.1 hypothetical protein Ga0076813_15792 [endosymbiont of Ridgeia piscesae]
MRNNYKKWWLMLSVSIVTGGAMAETAPVVRQDSSALGELPWLAQETKKLLDGADLRLLQKSAARMKKMAPRLRIQLRGLHGLEARKFDSSGLERQMSKAQQVLGQLLALYLKEPVNPLRSHLLVDNLRRQYQRFTRELKTLEAWVDDQHYKVVDQDEAARKLLHKHDNLIRQLIEYSEVLANAVDTALGKALESDA